jgi:hypothetical protein
VAAPQNGVFAKTPRPSRHATAPVLVASADSNDDGYACRLNNLARPNIPERSRQGNGTDAPLYPG